MKVRAGAMVIMVLALSFAGAAPAAAQEGPQPLCEGLPGAFSIDPSQGSAGSTAGVSGTGTDADSTILVFFIHDDEGLVIELIGTFSTDSSGNFSGEVTIPTDATTGEHNVAFADSQQQRTACVTFTVTELTGQQDAYTRPSSLPATGVSFIIPAAGLAAAGLLAALHRRRFRGPSARG